MYKIILNHARHLVLSFIWFELFLCVDKDSRNYPIIRTLHSLFAKNILFQNFIFFSTFLRIHMSCVVGLVFRRNVRQIKISA